MTKDLLLKKQSQRKLQVLTGYQSSGNPKTHRNSLNELTRVILHPPYDESTPQALPQSSAPAHHVLTISREKLTPQLQSKEQRESCIGIQAEFLLTPTRTEQLQFTPSQPAALHRLYRESPQIGSSNINARDISFDYLDSQFGSEIGEGFLQDSFRKPRHSIDSFIFSSQRVYEAPYGVNGVCQTEGKLVGPRESYYVPPQSYVSERGVKARVKKQEIILNRLNINQDAFTPKNQKKQKVRSKSKYLEVSLGSHQEQLLEQVGNLQKRASPILRASYYDAKHLPLKTFLTKNKSRYKGKWGYLERGKTKEKQAPQEFNLLAELAPAKLASYYKKVYNQEKKK